MHPNWVIPPSQTETVPLTIQNTVHVHEAPWGPALTNCGSPGGRERSLRSSSGTRRRRLPSAPIPQMGQSEARSSPRSRRAAGTAAPAQTHPPAPNDPATSAQAPARPWGRRAGAAPAWAPSPTCDHRRRALAPLRSQPHLQRERVPGQLEVGPQAQLLASPAEIERPARRARLLRGAPRDRKSTRLNSSH